MFYAKVVNGVITDTNLLKNFFPTTSFPKTGPTAEFLTEASLFIVSNRKDFNSATQRLESCSPYLEDGVVYGVRVVDLTQEELDARKASKAAQKRAERDRLLAACDWRVIRATETGVAMSTEWATYRQALRDITADANFPDVDMPHDPDWVDPLTE